MAPVTPNGPGVEVSAGESFVGRLGLRLEETATALGVCPNTLRAWVKAGLVPHRRVRGIVLFSEDVVRGWVRNEKEQPGQEPRTEPPIASGATHE